MSAYEAYTVEEYTYKGHKRRKFHRIGRMTENRDGGFSLFIPRGISVSGRVLLFPEGSKEIDLHQAYESAADEHGL